MIIEINKDIDKYQESIVLGLTARQLLYSVASVLVGGSIVLLLYRFIGLTSSAYIAVPCIAPIALQGFYSYNGMSFFEYWKKKIFYITSNIALNYKSTEGGTELEEYERLLAAAENGKRKMFGKKATKPASDTDSRDISVSDNNDKNIRNQNVEEFENMKEKMKRTFIALAVGVVLAVIGAFIAKQFI